MTLFAFALLLQAHAADWTKPVQVFSDTTLCVTYRAKVAGSYLLIEAVHESPWHTYAIDNRQRAAEKLAGRKSTGIDRPTEIKVSGGLALDGPWLQSEPKDLSKPEIRWYTFGFEQKAVFAAKVKRVADAPAQIALRGQACTESTCKNIEVEIEVAPAALPDGSDPDLKTLVALKP